MSPNSSPERNIGVPRLQSRTAKAFFHHAFSKGEDSRIFCFTFHPAVPTIVVVRSIVIVFSITLIMFPVIRNQVIERKAGMICDRMVLVIVLA